MQRILLDPPRPLLGLHAWPRERELAVEAGPPPTVDRLDRAATAEERRRPWFHPRRGLIRRLERAASHALARSVLPYVPGMHVPYDRLLRRQLTLGEAEIRLPTLPPAFDGLRILFVSDPHAGPFVSPEALGAAFERLMVVEPDLVCLGGDLVTARTCEFESHRRAFAALRAPLGVFAVLGNHDHYSGEPERLRAIVERAGIPVLHNRSVTLSRGADRLVLAGVDDLLLGEPDLGAALDGATGAVILMSHNPDLFFEAARRDVALVLAGHTHGGQVRLPGLPVLVRQSRYRLDEGRYRVGGSELVVSRGLGAVAVPWRVRCPPEGVLVQLRCGGVGTGAAG